MSLQGKRIIITGATDGLGLFLTKKLIEVPYEAKVIAIGKRNLEDTQLNDFKDKLVYFKYDIRELDKLKLLARNTTEVYNGVDLLINNACHFETQDTLSMEFPDIIDHFHVNTFFPFLYSKEIIKTMKNSNFGRIIMINTESSLQVRENIAAYASSKAALLSLSRALSQSLRGTNITSASLLLGTLATPYYVNEFKKAAILNDKDISQFTSEFILENYPYSTVESLTNLETILRTIEFIFDSNSDLNGISWKLDGGAISTIF